MNTSKLSSAIATLSLVLFMSIASKANSAIFYSGDLPKSGNKSMSVANTIDKDLTYLRFNVNKYVNETEAAEVLHSSLDYLRFDVNNYIETENSESMELPVKNEFDYLRFDVNNFTESNTDSMIELPVNEFDYLRFNANNYTPAGNTAIDELPVTE
jgi:hypothetical protein